jgi:phosphoglycolate phosphatase
MTAPMVFFDFDGTIADTEPGIIASWQHTFAALAMPRLSETEIRQLIGPSLATIAEQLTDDPALRTELLTIYIARYDTLGVNEASLYPGIVDMLGQLSDLGYRLMIATSKTERIAQHMLAMFGIDHVFEHVVGSLRDGTRRHKHDVIAHLLALLDEADTSRIVMIGDREHDVFGAAQHGIDCIGVLWGYGTQQELTTAGAVATVTAPGDLPTMLGKLLGS